MEDNERRGLTVIPNQDIIERQIIEEVLDAEIEKTQPLITKHLEALGPDHTGSELELFLKSFWNYLEGIRLIKEEGNFPLAQELLESAAAGFQQLGIEDLESVSRSFSTYTNALRQLQNLNINRCLELFDMAEEYLRNAGRFGRKFQPLIDHMKPEAMFIAAIPPLLGGDIGSARVLISGASDMMEKVAEKYYEKGDAMHFTILGTGQLYRAFFTYFQAQRDLSNLDLDKLISEDAIAAHAKEAEQLLAQGDLANVQVQSAHYISKALVELLQVTQGIAARMHLCFKAAFKADSQGFLDLRTKIHLAIDHASRAGPNAVPIVRSCDGLLMRIQNLEKLARPRKADFGIYSGLISSALFVPLLLVASWTVSRFGIELDNGTLFVTVVGLALIGGFGFGALRFKGFLFSGTQSDVSSE